MCHLVLEFELRVECRKICGGGEIVKKSFVGQACEKLCSVVHVARVVDVAVHFEAWG